MKDPEAFKDRLSGDEALMYRLASYYQVHRGIWKNSKLAEEGLLAIGGSD